MATIQNKRLCKSDQNVKEQLQSGKKALKYVHRKTEEMQEFMPTYLSFPDIPSPVSFIESLGDLNKDNASDSDLSE